MFELFQMWALVEILGIVFLPLAVTVFRNVPDRGWAWSKTLAVLVLSFCVWFPLMIFHALFFNWLFVFSVTIVLLALNVVGFFRTHQTIVQIIRSNGWYVLTTEAIFLLMVLILGWLRSFQPDIVTYERFMDEGFLASIMRSQHFPPSDMWYAGYSINYYYYAHYIVAMLAKLSGQIPSVAFNTGISMLYGLTAVGLFGLTSNIISWARHYRKQKQALQSDIKLQDQTASSDVELQNPTISSDVKIYEKPIYAIKNALCGAIPFALLTVVMALMLGNMASTVTVFTQYTAGLSPYWWFNVTRIIPNTINEFPAFSFLLSDFHAHVLSLAFTLLAIGFAFNFLLDQNGRGIFVYGRGWRLWLTLGTAAISMGGLFIMNGWDLPTYFGLVVVCIGTQQWLVYKKKLSLRWLENVLIAIIPLGILSALMYAPFFLTFISPSQGIGIVTINNRTSLNDEILIYALFGFVFISLLFSNILHRLLSSTNGMKFESTKTEVAAGQMDQEEEQEEQLPALADHDQGEYLSWSFIGTLTGLGFVIIGLICQFVSPQNATLFITVGISFTALVIVFQHIDDRAHAFTLFLGALAFALVAGCEIFFLRDVFVGSEPRMNTVFKFYFQAWILLSIACGAGLYFILENFRSSKLLVAPLGALRNLLRGGKIIWTICLALLLLAGCLYPILAPYYRYALNPITNQMGPLARTNSLDGMTYLQDVPELSGDYPAIRWLNANVTGTPVIVEAVDPKGGDYTNYSRISAFTGLPTIMGWVGHEYQWRVTWLDQNATNAANFNSRSTDVSDIYSDPDTQRVEALLAHYHAEYLYVGEMERMTYPNADLSRFSNFMQVVYHADGVTIYKVKA